MNIDNVFNVRTIDLKEIFVNNQSKCYYIPAYQRPYSWETDQIVRTWQDIEYGLNQLDTSDDFITFLGSIITLNDTSHKSISPIVRGEVPSPVMLIIDGQQRLTTMLIFIIVLENAISNRLTKKLIDSLGFAISLDISSMAYKSPKASGISKVQSYPKMIRAYDDQWSTSQKEQYKSPIASFLYQYIQFREENEFHGRDFQYKVNEEEVALEDSYKKIQSNYKTFEKLIKKFLEEDNRHLHEKMINNATQLGIEKEILDKFINDHKDDEKSYQIFILSLILRYLFHRVFLAEITAKKEEYAFEMFDSLNTTGDPLTAFETFKPKIIEHVKLENYFDSNAKRDVDIIEAYLNFDVKKRNKATESLISSFALTESGEKLSNKLRDQRIYLRNFFKETNNKDGFISNLRTVSEIYHIWNQAKHANYSTWTQVADTSITEKVLEDDTALTCLQFLSEVNHSISIPILSRFYGQKIEEFNEVLKSIVAFFILWRAVRQSTAGIDNIYRKLMKHGIPICIEKNPDGGDRQVGKLQALARDENNELSVENLKTAFRHCLLREASDNIQIHSKDEWVQKLVSSDIYSINKQITKFMLITAFDGVVSEPGSKGQVKKGIQGVANTLNRHFNHHFFESIEHISPQKNGFDGVSDERKHTLGNLTLLPQINNSSISDKPVKQKEKIFKALSSLTREDQDKAIQESGVNFNENTIKIIRDSEHFPYLRSLDSLEGWDNKVIEERTKNLGGIVWDKLAVEWLGFEK